MRKRWAKAGMAMALACALVWAGALAEGGYKLTLAPMGTLVLAPGDTRAMSVAIEPVNLMEHAVIWTSENPYVAGVSATGVISALAAGETRVTAAIESGASASVSVRVTGKPVTKLVIADADIELNLGKTAQLSYTINADADDKRVRWTTDDESVATVDQTGLVAAVGYGTAVITLTAANGISACASVYVPSDVASILLDPSEVLLSPGARFAVDAYVFPGNARNRELTWETSDARVATVDAEGVVSGVSAGQCLLRARTQNGVYALANVTVAKVPETLSFDEKEIALSRANRSAQIHVNVTPDAAQGCALAWTSTDTGVVEVQNGKLTAKAYGAATVTATAVNGLSASCLVRVCERAKSIAFAQSAYSLTMGEPPLALAPVFAPDEAYEVNITWIVDDASVALVDEHGQVTPVGRGTTRVTAVCEGGLTASCEIAVHEDMRSIAFQNENYTLPAFTRLELGLSMQPPEAAGLALEWQSSNPAVCAVIGGALYAQTPGEVTITASVPDSALSCECRVTVIENARVTPKHIALTFDNGPSENTPRILNALSDFGAKGTFFLLGANVRARGEIAALFLETAHEIGNHTYQNDSLNMMGIAEIATSIEHTDVLIQAATGRAATVLRAPDANLPVRLFTTFLDTRRFVGWSADTLDARRDATPESVREKALAESFDCAILTFHDSGAYTAEALYEILPELILQGYRFSTVSELIEITGDTSPVFTTKR